MNIQIRPYRPADLEALKQLTVESFGGVTLEQNIEDALGVLNSHDWRWRKARHIDDDVKNHPAGIFVAEDGGRVVGFITTLIDRSAGKGRIPNLAVAADYRGQGLGRSLIEHALDYFRRENLAIEVLVDKPVLPAARTTGRHDATVVEGVCRHSLIHCRPTWQVGSLLSWRSAR